MADNKKNTHSKIFLSDSEYKTVSKLIRMENDESEILRTLSVTAGEMNEFIKKFAKDKKQIFQFEESVQRGVRSTSTELGDFLDLTVNIVVSYVSNNSVPINELPILIRNVHQTLKAQTSKVGMKEPEKLVPAVSVERSVQPEYIICLEDGKKLKMLKRHLKTRYDMSPEEYRERWGLPDKYPMVAPKYTELRSLHERKTDVVIRAFARGRRKG